ncbi:mitochondrial 18 KDa protein-domain-containing protein [Kalaharituber pfeilii]|nr:mitochondrial 18 KDa protein-domain-containing protein [Kalaharituber pfeilii]
MGIREHLPTIPAPPTPQSQSEKKDEGIFERIYEGEAGESTESKIRYAGYGMRIRTILNATHRYVAYTSDIGESFRPVAHPWLVRGAYGVSWAYITGDVAYEGYKAYLANKARVASLPPQPSVTSALTSPTNPTHSPPTPGVKAPFLEDYRTVMAERFIFQAIASMGLPAFTIHSVVRYSGRAMKNVKNPRMRTWAPVALGLAVVPALPYMFDEPVEHGIKYMFRMMKDVVEGGGKATADKEKVVNREL